MKINDYYLEWITGDGVFTDLNEFDVPWKETAAPDILNLHYHGSHSGDKLISPLLRKMITADLDGTRSKVAAIIYNMYSDKWSHLWDALKTEYNPIDNYNMVENETSETNRENERAHTGTNTDAMTGTDNIAHTGNNENEISAFNSSNYVDSEKTTLATNDNETRDLQNQTTFNDTLTDEGTDTTERELTRHGNIGVTTTQQMLQSEIELRNWLFFKSVFEDIDKVLTLSIY